MRALLFFYALAACSPWPTYADPCTAIEGQLRAIAKQLSRGDTANAERALGRLEVAYPDCDDLVLDRARMQSAKGEEAADETFVHYSTLKPRDSRGWGYLARYLLGEGEYQRAETASSLATDNDPDDPVAMAVRGQILEMKGQSEEGIQLLEHAIRLNPDDAEARFQLGCMYDRAKHPKLAVKSFAEVVEMSPSDARAWDYLALDLEPLGEVDRAQKAYERGLAENRPGAYFDAFLHYNYGRFLIKRNQLAASMDQLDYALKSTPQVRAVWYERARLNVRLKKFQQARADAEKALSIGDPHVVIADLQVYVLLEQIYSRLGEMGLAQKYAELGRVTPSPVQSEIDRTH
jgi:tetratricopeptide (TPR) repeat protein